MPGHRQHRRRRLRRAPSTANELLADADRAMYESKEAGRDRVTVYADADRGPSPQDSLGRRAPDPGRARE